MTNQLLTKVENRSIHELQLLVEFIVSKTLHSSIVKTRIIGKRAFEWNETLKSKKVLSRDGPASNGELSEEEIRSLGEFLEPLEGLFTDAVGRRALIDRMRQARFRSKTKEKPTISVHVSGRTAQRLQNLRAQKGFPTPQDAIKFLLDSHYKKLKKDK